MLARLVPVGGGPDLVLALPVLLPGRGPECDLQFASPKVSRLHCCLALAGGCLLVRDLGSTNGTRVNGLPVREGRLDEGDELAVGDLSFRLAWYDGVPDSSEHPVPLP